MLLVRWSAERLRVSGQRKHPALADDALLRVIRTLSGPWREALGPPPGRAGQGNPELTEAPLGRGNSGRALPAERRGEGQRRNPGAAKDGDHHDPYHPILDASRANRQDLPHYRVAFGRRHFGASSAGVSNGFPARIRAFRPSIRAEQEIAISPANSNWRALCDGAFPPREIGVASAQDPDPWRNGASITWCDRSYSLPVPFFPWSII